MTSFRQSHVPKRGTLVPGRAEMQNAGRGGGWGLGRRRRRRSEERLTCTAAPIGCSSALLKLDGAPLEFGEWRSSSLSPALEVLERAAGRRPASLRR